MKVREIMTQSAVCCNPETNVGSAVELMWVRDCGMFPLLDPIKSYPPEILYQFQ